MKTITDTDLVVLEDLDFAPPCESKHGCDQTATWITEFSVRTCGHRFVALTCTRHLDQWVGQFQQVKVWYCAQCGARPGSPVTWRIANVLHRIEAL